MDSGEFRRRYERKNYSSDVIFSVRDKAYAGALKDISVGGAFVTTLSVGHVSRSDIVTISIPFTNGKQSVKRRGKVLWTNNDGFAMEFF